MLFALLLRSLEASSYYETCNESLLDPGYTCCNDSPCKGECVRIEGYFEKETCLTESQYQTCYTGQYFAVYVVIFCVPTIVFWVFSCVTKTDVPLCTWISNIIINISLGAIVTSITCLSIIPSPDFPRYCITAGILLLMITYIMSRMSILGDGAECCSNEKSSGSFKDIHKNKEETTSKSCCSCCSPKPIDPFNPTTDSCCGINEDTKESTYDCLRFIREVRSPHVTREELISIMDENASIPPTPQKGGVAYTNHNDSIIIVKDEREPIKFGSWQETAPREKITKEKVIYKCNPHYKYKENMREELERADAAITASVKGVSGLARSFDVFDFSGMTKRAIYGDNCVFNVFPTCCYRFFYEILFILGYNGISDFFWNLNAQRIVFKSMKEMSMDDSLRAKFGERDNLEFIDNSDNLSKEEEFKQSII